MVKCPARTGAREPKGSITDRDRGILVAISSTGVMTTQQIERLFDLSPDMARRRLRYLRDCKLVSVTVESMHACNRYRLTPTGRRFLSQWDGEIQRRSRPVASLLGRLNRHHERCVDAYISVLRATRQRSDIELDRFLFEPEIRALLHGGSGCVIPDAFAAIFSTNCEPIGLALEIDLGTEPVSYVVRTKGTPYMTLAETNQGILDTLAFRVCCITTSIERRNQIASSLWENNCPEGLWYLTTLDLIERQPFTDPIWVTPRLSDDGSRAILSTESPLPSPSRQGS